MMLEEFDQQNSSLVVERLDVPTVGESFIRVTRLKRGAFDIQHREGLNGPSSQAKVRGMRVAHEVLTRWAHRLPGWEAGAVLPPPPEPTPSRALFITSVVDAYIGPQGNDPIVPAIHQLGRLNEQTPLVDPAELKVALWFCVPGPLLSFDWQGFRVRGVDRKERWLEFEIAAPNELPGHHVNAFIRETLKQAPASAETALHRRYRAWTGRQLRFARRSITFSLAFHHLQSVLKNRMSNLDRKLWIGEHLRKMRSSVIGGVVRIAPGQRSPTARRCHSDLDAVDTWWSRLCAMLLKPSTGRSAPGDLRGLNAQRI
jgi:hypothetical protein